MKCLTCDGTGNCQDCEGTGEEQIEDEEESEEE